MTLMEVESTMLMSSSSNSTLGGDSISFTSLIDSCLLICCGGSNDFFDPPGVLVLDPFLDCGRLYGLVALPFPLEDDSSS